MEMKIGKRAFWLALSCGLTLLVGGAVADYLEVPAPVVKTSEVNSQGANTAPTFVVIDGRVVINNGNKDVLKKIAIQNDGKVLAVGQSDGDFSVLRLDKDGILDPAFGNQGYASVDFGGDDIGESLVIQSDGKIVVAGTSSDIDSYITIARFTPSGNLDLTFGVDGKVKTKVHTGCCERSYSVGLQSDGKIVVSGTGSYDYLISRFNPFGTLDVTFGSYGFVLHDFGLSDAIYSATIMPDDKILALGGVRNDQDFGIIKLLKDGQLDSDFGEQGKVVTTFPVSYARASGVAMKQDGGFIAVGSAGLYWNEMALALASYNANGVLDSNFGGSGTKLSRYAQNGMDTGSGVVLQSNGYIVTAGNTFLGWSLNSDEAWNFLVTRFDQNGNVDSHFGENGYVSTDFAITEGFGNDTANDIAIQADGRIIVGGFTASSGQDSSDYALSRYTVQGALDATFGLPKNTLLFQAKTSEQVATRFTPKAQIIDTELAALGTYAGATLTISRQGGANTEDVFSANSGGLLTVLNPGSYFAVDAVTIGQVITNSAGTLQLHFLGANATSARVDKAMQQIAYTNTSDRPPAQVLIDWTFNDGNTGAQGTGGALSTTGTVTVNITPVNDPPRLDNPPPAQTATAGTAFSYTLPANTFSDPDGDTLSYSVAMADNTGLPLWLTFNAATRTFSGTPSGSDIGTLSLRIAAKDPSNATAAAYLSLTVRSSPAVATVTLANLAHTYTGQPLSPTVTTSPAGLNYSLTGAPQTNAGNYPVTATINDQNYQGSASGTLIINQASQVALILQAGSTALFEGSSTTLSVQGGSTLGTVTYSAQATSGLSCSISGNELTATGSAGTCTVTANRAGDGNYLPVSSSPLAITVTLPQRQLVVSKNGSGAAYSSPSGISCGPVCSAYYNKYTPVTLTAEPASGQYFVGWSGACTGIGSCQLTMTDNRSVTATFAVIPQTGFTLTVSKTGSGTISSLSPNASINCGTACQGSFPAGQWVTLFAQPDRGHTFLGWSGQAAGMCGRQISCDVYTSSNQSISGDFKNTYVLIMPAIQLLLE